MAMNETVEPARGARAEPDGWAGVRIDDPLEVQQLLRQLLAGGVPVHLVSAQGDALSAQLGWLDVEHGRMSLTVDDGSARLQRVAQCGEAVAVAYLDRVRLQFDVEDMTRVHGQAGSVLGARIPSAVHRLQRRQAFRVRTGGAIAPRATLRHPSIPDMQLTLRIVDLSRGGCALQVPDDLPGLQPGTQLNGALVELDADTRFHVSLRLQHVTAMHASGPPCLGCAFTDLDAPAQNTLQRWIDRAQQRHRRLLAGD